MTYPVASFPNTAHSVFYAYTIVGNNVEIGSFEKFGSSFTRTHERIREIYFPSGPQTTDILWGGTDISITITQVELYDKSLFEAFGINIFSIEDFNQVVDIMEVMHKPQLPDNPQHAPTVVGDDRGDSLATRVITYKDCVPTNVTKDIDQSTAKIAVNMTLECRTVVGEYV